MWNFRIVKDNNIIGLVEMFYQSKRKKAGYSEFLLIGDSKTEILNFLKNKIKENKNLSENDSNISFEKNLELWSKYELRMMINDIKSKKIIDIEKIKFGKSFEIKNLGKSNFTNI